MDGRILGRSRTSPSREANSQDCTARWHRYVAAEQEYVAVRRALLNTDLSVVRASLQGRGPAGARGFRAAVHLRDALPMTWTEPASLRIQTSGRSPMTTDPDAQFGEFVVAQESFWTARRDLLSIDFSPCLREALRTGRAARSALRLLAFLPETHTMDHVEDVVTAAARGGAEAVLALDLLRTLDEGWLAMTLPAVVDKAVASADNLTGLAQTLEALGQQEARDRLRGAGA